MKRIKFTLPVIIMFCCSLCVYASIGMPKDLTDMNRLPSLYCGDSYMESSYDRSGGNNDGFEGTYSYIRKENGDSVIFEENGPGVIWRMWFPRYENNNKISIYIDDMIKPVLTVNNFYDFVNGNVYPFVKPIVGFMMGGGYSYVPIPFEKACKIVVHGNLDFYHFNWEKYPAGSDIVSFNTDFSDEYKADLSHAVHVWSDLGTNPNEVSKDSKKIKINRKIESGKTVLITDINTEYSGLIAAIKLKISSKDIRIFRKAVLLSYTDDITSATINSPIGDFFLDGFNQKYSKSLLLGIDKEKYYYCYIPMPFKKNWKLKIHNTSQYSLTVTGEILWDKKIFTSDTGYFYAYWHRDFPTDTEKYFVMLDAVGRGKLLGVSHAMQGINDHGYLEGDDMSFIDGRDNSKYNGTGTEDYFNGGWYFGETNYTATHGCGVYDTVSWRCLAYRLNITGGVGFKNNIRYQIEHGSNNTSLADYAGVTYFYGDKDILYNYETSDVLLPQSERVAKAFEAEKLLQSNHGQIIDDYDLNYTFSNGRAVKTNNYTMFNIDILHSGVYDISASLKGSCLLKIDKYSETFKTNALKLSKIFSKIYLKEGKHQLMISSANGLDMITDYLKIQPLDLPVEAEQMELINHNKDIPVMLQALDGLFGDVSWSNGAHILSLSKDIGNSYSLLIPVKQKNTDLKLIAYMTKASDYGIIRIYVEGKPVMDYDAFSYIVGREMVSLGNVNTDKDKIEVKFEVIGKNSFSGNYYSGVDCFYFE